MTDTTNTCGEGAELKPCPFDQEPAIECYNGDAPFPMYWTQCRKCHACPGTFNSREEASAAWNRRPVTWRYCPECALTAGEAVAWLTPGGDVTRSHAYAVEQSANDPANYPVALYASPQPARGPTRETFQDRVLPWLMECFGAEIAADRVERCDRFIEEALELTQSLNWTADRAHALVDYVFGRPIGEPHQEVGGVMVTLAALCQAAGLDMVKGGEDELARIMQPEIVAKIRAKQAAKPTGSALPVSLFTPSAGVDPTSQVGESLDDAARRLFAQQHPDRSYDDLKDKVQITWLRSAHKAILAAREGVQVILRGHS